jgi:hypothetical protein
MSRLMQSKMLQTVMETPHPAVRWAETAPLDPLQIDCVTAVMLKILDNKCKMSSEEQIALMAVYSVVKERDGVLFDDSIHKAISHAMQYGDISSSEKIHELRLHAEQEIPKPVMKHFKRFLRASLYGV